jgi:hypothetical protein
MKGCCNTRMPRPDSATLLRPTPKARRELHPGVQTLTLRQRSVLLLAEHESAGRLGRLFNGTGEQIVCDLLERGYLAPQGPNDEPMLDRSWKADINGIEPIHEDI